MAVVLLTSQGWCRREATILPPPEGLGKAREGEEHPSARCSEGQGTQRRAKARDTKTRGCASFLGTGGGVSFTLALGGPAGGGRQGGGGRLLGRGDGVLPAARGVPER